MTAGLVALDRARRLGHGDRVAVVAPSGPVVPERLERGVAVLESWGLEVVVGRHALARRRHLAGTDEERAEDLQRAWCDPAVRAVLCARGGSGAARIVDRLDWAAMRAAGPRVLVGFSDATVLHQAVANRLGLSTLFGPMAATEVFAGADAGDVADSVSVQRLRTTLFEPQRGRVLAEGSLRCEVAGRARGCSSAGRWPCWRTPSGRPSTGRPGAASRCSRTSASRRTGWTRC